jgi:hypothetical protein
MSLVLPDFVVMYFLGAYKLKSDPGSGSGKSFEDISVIPEPENS